MRRTCLLYAAIAAGGGVPGAVGFSSSTVVTGRRSMQLQPQRMSIEQPPPLPVARREALMKSVRAAGAAGAGVCAVSLHHVERASADGRSFEEVRLNFAGFCVQDGD